MKTVYQLIVLASAMFFSPPLFADDLTGKTVWIGQGADQASNIVDSSCRISKLGSYEPVKVIGIASTAPCGKIPDAEKYLFVERASGETGYYPFKDDLIERENPFPNGWDKQTIQLIQQRKVSVGMKPEQVTMSWGKPERISRHKSELSHHEQWIYGYRNYVYFYSGIVSRIQAAK